MVWRAEAIVVKGKIKKFLSRKEESKEFFDFVGAGGLENKVFQVHILSDCIFFRATLDSDAFRGVSDLSFNSLSTVNMESHKMLYLSFC